MSSIASPAVALAYQAIQNGAGAGPAQPASNGGGFAAALEEAARSAVQTLGAAEQTSMKAAAGQADLLEVISSVNDAESTLRTVVAVRDKIVQGYQEILRMPI